jgi:hypothetical protein
MSNTSPDRHNRSYRQLYDLNGRTFVEANYPFPELTACYGCSRMFAANERHAFSRGFVTSAQIGPKENRVARQNRQVPEKHVFWVCPECFEDFSSHLKFKLTKEFTLMDVLDGPALGPPI